MKRILLFSVAYHPFVGGAEIAVKEITDRISDIEFDMITLNLSGHESSVEKVGNITVYRIGHPGMASKLLFPFTAFFTARKLHRQNPYSATWSIMASFSGFAALFFKYSQPSVPFLLSLQEGDPIDSILKKVRIVGPVFRKIFKKADRIQAISTYLAKFAVDMGATVVPFVIPNGVDLSLFSATFPIDAIKSVRREIGCADEDMVLVTVSRLVTKNGIGDIIDSLAHLEPSVKLLIIGSGPLEQELRSKVRTLGLEQRVIFKGFVEYASIPKYLAASTIFVRPSLSEGMGNSFIEAMAAGLPVIATCVGGIPDFLHDGETGLFCNVSDPESISKAVDRLRGDAELCLRLSQNGRKLAQNYDWGRVAEDMKTSLFSI